MLWRKLMAFLLPFALVQAQEAPSLLNIVIVEGEGAVHNVRKRVAREPMVEVEDRNRKPVGGALVTFLLPRNGAGGTFADGSHSLTVTTDNSGRAVARGIKPNHTNGKFEIRVNATHDGQTARATITQVNEFAVAVMSAKTITLLAIAAGVVTGVVIGVTRNGGSTPASPTGPAPVPPTIITPGNPTVGGPK